MDKRLLSVIASTPLPDTGTTKELFDDTCRAAFTAFDTGLPARGRIIIGARRRSVHKKTDTPADYMRLAIQAAAANDWLQTCDMARRAVVRYAGIHNQDIDAARKAAKEYQYIVMYGKGKEE